MQFIIKIYKQVRTQAVIYSLKHSGIFVYNNGYLYKNRFFVRRLKQRKPR